MYTKTPVLRDSLYYWSIEATTWVGILTGTYICKQTYLWRLCRRSHTKVELKKLSLGSLDEGDDDNEVDLDTSMDSATPTERHAMEYDSSDIGMVGRGGFGGSVIPNLVGTPPATLVWLAGRGRSVMRNHNR
jgi:hypothetical protein